MRRALIFLSTILMMTAPGQAQEEAVRVYDPQGAIAAAAEAKDGVGGLFVMTVGSAAKAGGTFYINSEEDYRDPANLSVAVDMDIFDSLSRAVGGDPETVLPGKRIRVAGVAKATPIKRRRDRDGKVLYHQTRIYMYDPRQFELLD